MNPAQLKRQIAEHPPDAHRFPVAHRRKLFLISVIMAATVQCGRKSFIATRTIAQNETFSAHVRHRGPSGSRDASIYSANPLYSNVITAAGAAIEISATQTPKEAAALTKNTIIAFENIQNGFRIQLHVRRVQLNGVCVCVCVWRCMGKGTIRHGAGRSSTASSIDINLNRPNGLPFSCRQPVSASGRLLEPLNERTSA